MGDITLKEKWDSENWGNIKILKRGGKDLRNEVEKAPAPTKVEIFI